MKYKVRGLRDIDPAELLTAVSTLISPVKKVLFLEKCLYNFRSEQGGFVSIADKKKILVSNIDFSNLEMTLKLLDFLSDEIQHLQLSLKNTYVWKDDDGNNQLLG